MSIRNPMAALLSAGFLLAKPCAADEMQVSAGHGLARQWCSSCHVIEKDQAQPATDSVPSFFAIANDSTTTEDGLRTFLGTPHASMPNISLSREEVTNLIAYLMSLKGS